MDYLKLFTIRTTPAPFELSIPDNFMKTSIQMLKEIAKSKLLIENFLRMG